MPTVFQNHPMWLSRIRALAVPVLGAFLSLLFVAVKPISDLGGDVAFLVYTAQLLFFFPRGGILEQIETGIIGMIGMVIGMAWSMVTLAIAAYCGRVYGSDSDQARGILGLGLALLAFASGFVKSYAPRYLFASNIALFFPIFLLTSCQDITHVHAYQFLQSFYVSLWAAGLSILVTMVLPRPSSAGSLEQHFHQSVKLTCELLPLSLSSVVEADIESDEQSRESQGTDVSLANAERGKVSDTSTAGTLAKQEKLARELKTTTRALYSAHQSWTREITYGSLAPTSLVPILDALKRIQKNALLGPTSHAPGERIRAALERTYARTSRPGTPRGYSSDRHRNGVPPDPLNTALANAQGQRLGHPEYHTWPRSHSPRGNHAGRSTPPNMDKLLQATRQVVSAVGTCLETAKSVTGSYYSWCQPTTLVLDTTQSVQESKTLLDYAVSDLQRHLMTLLDGEIAQSASQHVREGARIPRHVRGQSMRGIEMSHSTSGADTPLHSRREHTADKDRFRLAFYLTALLDLAKDVNVLLGVVGDLDRQSNRGKRWWFPTLKLFPRRWSVHKSPASGVDDGTADPAADVNNSPNISTSEREEAAEDLDFVRAALRHNQPPHQVSPGMMTRLARSWRRYWDQSSVLKARILLSHALHHIRHSSHVLFAIKMALGVSLLAAPALLPPGYAGRDWYVSWRGAWATISYMFVLDLHTGAIFKIAMHRCAGTLIGAVAAYVSNVIAHGNPYALVVLGTACSVPITYLILFTSRPIIGTIAGITLPPLLFLTYLGYNTGESHFSLAWTRFVDINIGILGAVLVGVLIWPCHARVQYLLTVSSTMEKATDYYLHMSRDLLRSSLIYQVDSKLYERLESRIRDDIAITRNLVIIQRKEISLLPRPLRLYGEVTDAVERLIDMLSEIKTLRFNVPRKATVLDVLPIRREVVSAILINLWAISQSFRSRSPLPQYLPSPRAPIAELLEAIDEHARRVRYDAQLLREDQAEGSERKEKVAGELAVLYALAENEALSDVCDIVDELVAAARTLFGSQTFLEVKEHDLFTLPKH